MEIIPAIDIREGRCVRLYQGDYRKQTIYGDDPVEIALRWRSQGARWLHIVDLSGAASGEVESLPLVEAMVKESGLLVEFGGGVRQVSVVEELLRKGVKRVILGTAAIENPAMVKKLCRRFGEAIAVSLDAREGKVSTHGWRKDTAVDALELAKEMVENGVSRFIFTDIKRDGTLTEPNFEMVERLVRGVNVPLVAAGGVSRLEHLERLKKLGVEGVVIGKALYTGDIDLTEAIALAGR